MLSPKTTLLATASLFIYQFAAAGDALYQGPAFEAFKRSHPVRSYYGHNPDWMRDRQKEADTWIASLNAGAIQALIPKQVTSPECTCPVCGKKDSWKLDANHPDKLLCGGCKNTYPNKDYPENKQETDRA